MEQTEKLHHHRNNREADIDREEVRRTTAIAIDTTVVGSKAEVMAELAAGQVCLAAKTRGLRHTAVVSNTANDTVGKLIDALKLGRERN